MDVLERAKELGTWANQLVRTGSVEIGIGPDGFATGDDKNIHLIHEVVFFASVEKESLNPNEIVARTWALQQSLNLPLSKVNAVKSQVLS